MYTLSFLVQCTGIHLYFPFQLLLIVPAALSSFCPPCRSSPVNDVRGPLFRRRRRKIIRIPSIYPSLFRLNVRGNTKRFAGLPIYRQRPFAARNLLEFPRLPRGKVETMAKLTRGCAEIRWQTPGVWVYSLLCFFFCGEEETLSKNDGYGKKSA